MSASSETSFGGGTRALGRATHAELRKLRRPGMLWGGIGVMVGLTILLTTLLFAAAVNTPNLRASDCTRDPAIPPTPEEIAQQKAVLNHTATPQRGPPSFSFCRLQKPEAMISVFGFSSQLLGVVALVLFAQSMGAEYGQGTLKVLLSREPRRIIVLVGKIIALALFVWCAAALAALTQVGVASAMAAAKGIHTDQWWTSAGIGHAFAVIGRAEVSIFVWGLFGTLLAVLFRSAPPAIGIGIGYTILGEGLLGLTEWDALKWLPGRALTAFVNWNESTAAEQGVTSFLPPWTAAAAIAAYGILFAVSSGFLLAKRDVT